MSTESTANHADTPLRVGLVGFGTAGAVFHAPLIAATEGLALDTVVTADPERRARAAREYPGVRLVDSAERLLEDGADRLDLLVVASPNRTHVPLARAALRAGLPVVVDKPLAPTAREGRELVDLAAERGLLLTVFHNRRWDGDFRTVRTVLDSGALGTVTRFESRFDRWRPAPKGGWRESADPAEVGGLLYDLGSHLVDQALQLFGPAARVYAEADVRRPGTGADDDSFIALTHTSGVRSHLWMGTLASQRTPRFRVFGTAGSYLKYGLDPQEGALRAGLRPGGEGWGAEPQGAWGTIGADAEPGDLRTLATEPGDYPAFYAAVGEALRGRAPAPVEAAQAVDVLTVLEAAHASAASGEVVAL
ncbi:Gfo/Idh/MocA family protein [Allostreptomyces psammosilenae]|uniref:Putative dehydrogenase n=1 Tax=Allostreptomyces psammosilenae TaxID=1892865 RepID=A0A852ZW15_9ACTN|nr:Gfo/Idh/MocA family oxidoreductase [Allostreptomyces psammosilenae]NYI04964.1 putative dehydrogenase [Allostreptomyces psammosilenae]